MTQKGERREHEKKKTTKEREKEKRQTEKKEKVSKNTRLHVTKSRAYNREQKRK